MTRTWLCVLLLAAGLAQAAEPEKKQPAPATAPAKPGAEPAKSGAEPAKAGPADKAKDGDKAKDDPDLGMSILGNQEAPKSLVIVPWKSSEIGNSVGIATMLDDSRQPIDKEVFMRVLSYYELTVSTTHRRKQ